MRRLIAVTALTFLSQLSQRATPTPPVALVTEARGDVRTAAGDAVARLTWITDGTRVRTAKNATLVVMFWNGKRWRIEGGGTAQAGRDGLTRIDGRIVALESSPPMPYVPSVDPDLLRRAGYGAALLRAGGHWVELFPERGTWTLADSTTLTFLRLPAGSGAPYRIQVIGEDTVVVFETETRETRVAIPAGRLRPGASYKWTVRSMADSEGAVGNGEFSTLDRRIESARRILREAHPARDAATLAMLAELDRVMGLLAEARRDFAEALKLSPDDPNLRARVEELLGYRAR